MKNPMQSSPPAVKPPCLMLILLPLVLLASCVTEISTPIIVDDTVPEEQLAAVYFDSTSQAFHPSEVNGEKLARKGHAIKLPAGETTVKGDMAYVYTAAESRYEVGQIFRRKDVQFVFTFEAGKTYQVKTGITGESGFRIVMNVPFRNTATVVSGPPFYAGVNIYRVERYNEKQQPTTDDGDFISYVPFQNNVFFGTEKPGATNAHKR